MSGRRQISRLRVFWTQSRKDGTIEKIEQMRSSDNVWEGKDDVVPELDEILRRLETRTNR